MGGAGECADAVPVTPANHGAHSQAHDTAFKDSASVFKMFSVCHSFFTFPYPRQG